ncbi:translation initiation factor IF-2-like [Venturia canescens]|uniref:translation initiation factor IF-2-like n=1 Tax=Venturia canescens TaxID=32260 RepID=UPI001C9CB3B8|nr:translation initiation factor IF-2-like [Venturia canescens]
MELRVTTASTLVVLVLLEASSCTSEKLTPGQKAPASAKGSGGLALKAPYEAGGQAADVGRRGGQAIPGPPAPAPSGGSTQQVDGVVREETEELKEVDGQLVRVVKGNFAYDSPEGLPIAVKYVADENGNRASFTFGTGKPSGGAASRPSGGTNRKPGLTPGGPSATSLGGAGGGGRDQTGSGGKSSAGRPPGQAGGGANGQGGASTYLPPTSTKVDRSYLPPN